MKGKPSGWSNACANNRSGRASRMREEDLKECLTAARRGEKGETADKDGGGREDTQDGA